MENSTHIPKETVEIHTITKGEELNDVISLSLPTWLHMTDKISQEEYEHMIKIMEQEDLSRYNITQNDFSIIKNDANEIIAFGRTFTIGDHESELWSLRVDERYRGKKLWLLLSQKLIKERNQDNQLYLATKKELGPYYQYLWFKIITQDIPEKLIHTWLRAQSQGIDFIIMKLP